jgi:CubicO group peptidase (beta-lactamase class C family)
MLVEEGKVGLDDSIAKYFPDGPASWMPIKVRNLLSHTSGLRNYSDAGKSIDFHKDYTWPELLKIIEALPVDFDPGEQWQYSNTNYLLLGELIENVSGKSWGDFMEDRIFGPLGMKSTHAVSASRTAPRLATGYHMDVSRLPVVGLKSKFKETGQVAPVFERTADGNLNITAVDLAKWDAALYTEKLLKKSSLDQMWTVARLNNGSSVGYGFGWFIEQRNGHRLVDHSGGTPGFESYVARYLDDKLTVAVLTNVDGLLCQPPRIAHAVAAMYEPALGPGPKPPDEPEVTDSVRDLVSKIAAGRPLEGWTRDQLKSTQAYFAAVKPLTSLELIGREQQGDRRSYVYRLQFADLEFPCKFVFDMKDQLVSLDAAY